jgi:hypothetical protein
MRRTTSAPSRDVTGTIRRFGGTDKVN